MPSGAFMDSQISSMNGPSSTVAARGVRMKPIFGRIALQTRTSLVAGALCVVSACVQVPAPPPQTYPTPQPAPAPPPAQAPPSMPAPPSSTPATSATSVSADVQARRDRGARRADRALSGLGAVAGADGVHLSAGNRPRRALAQGESEREGRGSRQGGRRQALGCQREVAGGLPADPRADERQARLDAAAGRCLPRAAEGGARCRAAPAGQGAGERQPEEHRAAEGDRGTGTDRQHAADDHHRAGESAGGLRAGLQPEHGLRLLGLSGVSAVLLATVSGLLPGLRLRRRHRLRALAWRRRARSSATATGAAATSTST